MGVKGSAATLPARDQAGVRRPYTSYDCTAQWLAILGRRLNADAISSAQGWRGVGTQLKPGGKFGEATHIGIREDSGAAPGEMRPFGERKALNRGR